MQLSDPGIAEELAESAGLELVERGDHEVVGLDRTIEDAYLGLEAAGANWGAIEHSGPESFHAPLHEAIEPYTDPASGHVRIVATIGHLVARKACIGAGAADRDRIRTQPG